MGVGKAHALGDEVLAGAHGHDEDHVAIVVEVLLQSPRTRGGRPCLKVEGRLRDESKE